MIGSAGSEEKCKYLKELGFDEVFNYKTTSNLDAKLKELAPDGIDVYFDNVINPSFILFSSSSFISSHIWLITFSPFWPDFKDDKAPRKLFVYS